MSKVVIFTILILGFSINLFAGKVYHCENSDGKKSFQDKPCESTTVKVEDVKANPINRNTNTKSSSKNFYGISIHPTAMKKEVTDVPTIDVASLRYISRMSSSKIVNYYKKNITEKYKERDLGDTTMLSYKVDGKNKVVSVMDYFGKADVTLQSEK